MTTDAQREHVAKLMDKDEFPEIDPGIDEKSRKELSEENATSSTIPEDEIGGRSKLIDEEPEEEEDPEPEEEEDPEEEEEEDPEEEGDDKPKETSASLTPDQIAKLQREAYAAAKERDRLRTLRRQDKAEMELVKADVAAVAAELRKATAGPEPDESQMTEQELYFKRRLDGLDERSEVPPAVGPTVEQINDTRNYARSSSASLRAAMPSGQFDSAYDYARRKLSEESGLTGEAFNIYEQALAWEMMEQGHDIAIESVRYAEHHGWKPGELPTEDDPKPKTPEPEISETRVRRMKRGVNQSAVDETITRAPRRHGGTITRKQFYQRFTADQRKEFYMKNPDAFSVLAEHGRMPAVDLPQEY